VNSIKIRSYVIIIVTFLLLIIFSTYVLLRIHNNLSPTNARIGGPYYVEGAVKTISGTDSVNAEITGTRNNAIVQAIRKVGKSVVSISTMHVVRDSLFERGTWFDFFYPNDVERKYYGLGSGFIIDERGYIVTNHHVIIDSDVIKVTLSNGKQYEAKIVGSDKESDLAVLKIDAPNLTIAELGDSNDLMIGEWIIAIGNPFGYLMKDSQPTVTVGVVSATGRAFQKEGVKLNNLIQTDAAINPGNSGGPLVNSFGQVIGINSAIFSTTGGYQGVGFAIPINSAKKVITKLIQFGRLNIPWLGVRFQDISADIAEHLGLDDTYGTLVSYVAEGSPAQKSGLMNGDVIVSIGDQKVNSADDAIEISRLLSNDDNVNFRVLRKGEFRDIFIKIESDSLVNAAESLFGIVVQSPTPEMAKKYGLSSDQKGVMIAQIKKDSPADKAELKVGDLILKFAKIEDNSSESSSTSKDINDLNDFIEFISDISKGQVIRVIFWRENEVWQTYLTALGN
jgi:serine protease Do